MAFAETLSQENRHIAIDTPLGKDVLCLEEFNGHEAFSQLFTYELDLLSIHSPKAPARNSVVGKTIDPLKVLGEQVTFKVQYAPGDWRFFNGFVRRFRYTGRVSWVYSYHMEVVPWLWFLTRTTDCRIFQEMNVQDMIEKVFDNHSYADYKFDLQKPHPEWEYCVQYRETDFNFVSRMMEQEGMFYYFEHDDGKHTMVIADHAGAYKDAREKDMDFRGEIDESEEFNILTEWEHQYNFVSGKYVQRDYNFKTPEKNLEATAPTKLPHKKIPPYELYDYPGEYENVGDGQADTDLRIEEEEDHFDTIEGKGVARSFGPGFKFNLIDHPFEVDHDGYVVCSVHHFASARDAYVGGGAGGGEVYNNSFTCMPAKVPYRPPMATPKPCVMGSQTAIVVGPKGEEIYTDEYGRIKVQFYWDRYHKKDETSSCWIRCSQTYAGKNWGAMYIPRIGQEVVVSYLEGDPDRPLVTGVVYNADQMPPYDPPTHKTRTYFKSNTSKGGEGYNEYRFEDKAGEEQIFIHAEKDWDLRIRNDSRTHIIHDRHEIVGPPDPETYGNKYEDSGCHYEEIRKHREVRVYENEQIHIEGNHKTLIGHKKRGKASGGEMDLITEKDRRTMIEQKDHLIVKDDRLTNVKKNDHLKVDMNQNEKIGQNLSVDVGQNIQVKAGMKQAYEAGMQFHIKGGMQVVIEGGAMVSLKCGGSHVTLTPAAVFVAGPLVNINSGGSAGSFGGCSPTAPTAPDEAQKADPTVPDEADKHEPGKISTPGAWVPDPLMDDGHSHG